MSNLNLKISKEKKNDEFYTKYEDIENELNHYKNYFKNKIVYCNCDDPSFSNFWKYFHINFSSLGLKKLISTHYIDNGSTYKMEYIGGDDNNIETGIKTDLQGNGDFRNQECLDILSKSDVIVSNSPFSLWREYFQILISSEKRFLIIGNMNAITYKEVFPYIRANKVWLGYTSPKEFIEPNGNYKKFGNILWYTNIDIEKNHEFLYTGKKYMPENYIQYDNFDAININRLKDIPDDYYGIMGVPITFLMKYNPDQFQILGVDINDADELGIKPISEEWLTLYRKQGGTGHYTSAMKVLTIINEKAYSPYKRILIQRKN